jgi:hypothetical protein
MYVVIIQKLGLINWATSLTKFMCPMSINPTLEHNHRPAIGHTNVFTKNMATI